jgi:hypothetical protein
LFAAAPALEQANEIPRMAVVEVVFVVCKAILATWEVEETHIYNEFNETMIFFYKK